MFADLSNWAQLNFTAEMQEDIAVLFVGYSNEPRNFRKSDTVTGHGPHEGQKGKYLSPVGTRCCGRIFIAEAGLHTGIDNPLSAGGKCTRVSATIIRFVLIVFSFLTIISLWGFYFSIRPPKLVSSLTPRDLKMAYQDVSFRTADGLTLRGWHIPSIKTTGKNLILLHGYPADKGNILPALAFLHEDFNLLLFDFRYLGKSEGGYSAIGAKEVEDLLAAIQFLKTRGVKEVGVWGFSMGGAVALMAIEKVPEIRAVIAESSYASLAQMALQLFRIPLLNYPIAYLVGVWSKLFLGIDLRDVSPAERVRNTTVPILLIHSSADAVIPFSHAQSLQKALAKNSRAEFWFNEGSAHGQLASDYESRVRTFFHKNL